MGSREVLDENYLAFRIGQVRPARRAPPEAGVPIVQPVGRPRGLPRCAAPSCRTFRRTRIPRRRWRSRSTARGASASVEIGGVMFGSPIRRSRRGDPARARSRAPDDSAPRLHEHASGLRRGGRHQCFRIRETLRGVRIVRQAPFLRHFTAEFEPSTAQVQMDTSFRKSALDHRIQHRHQAREPGLPRSDRRQGRGKSLRRIARVRRRRDHRLEEDPLRRSRSRTAAVDR